MKRRIVTLYEIKFLDELSILNELQGTLNSSIDILKETRKNLLNAAYSTEDRRRLANRVLKEKRPVRVQKEDILWAYFPPELTRWNQTKFRSFFVKEVVYQKNRVILTVRLSYEKQRNWFDLQL
ncbi:hypothetical protein FQS96_14120 [Enterococcus faecalis]|uniref:hypothetical protein n=1 Tax=Enterococcus TaxID=1350 RepID=UPI001A9644FE|nr:hypothetical protein [Enterococcus faecalis]MBO1126573.1 hypothetical protein [Enterococcus faecalis]